MGVCAQASGKHGAAHMGGRKKLAVPVASPALPPDTDTLASPSLVRTPPASKAAIRLARQAMGSAGKRAGLPAHPALQASRTQSWRAPSVYDSRQGPASAAVAAVASSPDGAPRYSTSPEPSVVGEESFDVKLPPQSATKDDGISEADLNNFLAFNVIMSPSVAKISDSNHFAGSSDTSASGGTEGGALSSQPESRAHDSETSSTELLFSEMPRPRRSRTWQRNRRPRPQSAPAVQSRTGASTLTAWDDIESRPSFELSGLRTGVHR